MGGREMRNERIVCLPGDNQAGKRKSERFPMAPIKSLCLLLQPASEEEHARKSSNYSVFQLVLSGLGEEEQAAHMFIFAPIYQDA